MASTVKERPGLLPWKDPLQAEIPTIRHGSLGAVYYGQRRSGDFYDFVRSSPARVVLGLFDVAGDLRRTRPIVLALQAEFRRAAAELFAGENLNEAELILELWILLNRELMRSVGGVHSCPAFLGCYSEDLKTLCYVNSGHTPGMVRHRGQVRELGATALPLGLFSHTVPDCSLIALAADDALLLVSRGIVEARHRGHEFGLDRAKQFLLEAGPQNGHELCVSVLSQVRQFMGTAPTHNDVTAVCLVRTL